MCIYLFAIFRVLCYLPFDNWRYGKMERKFISLLALTTVGLLNACDGNSVSSISSAASSSSSSQSSVAQTAKDLGTDILNSYKNGEIKLPESQNFGFSSKADASVELIVNYNNTNSYNIDGTGSANADGAFIYDGEETNHSAGYKAGSSLIGTIVAKKGEEASVSTVYNESADSQIEVSDKIYQDSGYVNRSKKDNEDEKVNNKENKNFAAIDKTTFYNALINKYNDRFSTKITTFSGASLPASAIPEKAIEKIGDIIAGEDLAVSPYVSIQGKQIDNEIGFNASLKASASNLISSVDFASTVNSYIKSAFAGTENTTITGKIPDIVFSSLKVVLPTSAKINETAVFKADSYLPVQFISEINLSGMKIKGSYYIDSVTSGEASSSSSSEEKTIYSFDVQIDRLEAKSSFIVSYGSDVTSVRFSDSGKTDILANGTDNTSDIADKLGIN